MLTTILSVLGIGGGLAIAFIPGFGKRLIEMAGAVLGVIKEHPWQAAQILSLCAIFWLWTGWSAAERREEVQHTGWVNEIKGRKADRAAYVEAQRLAKEQWEAKLDAEQAETARLAREADNASDQILALRSASDRFAGARGLSRFCGPAAAQGLAGRSAEDAPLGSPEDRDGPGADAVVLTRPEYDEFVANTLRLERVRRWGETLIEAKRAIPEVEFGKGD